MLKPVVCKICLKSGYPLPLSLRSFYILEIYRRALKKYVPKAYDGSLVIFMSKDNPGNSKNMEEARSARDREPGSRWQP